MAHLQFERVAGQEAPHLVAATAQAEMSIDVLVERAQTAVLVVRLRSRVSPSGPGVPVS